MVYRVIQWATGNVGCHSLRAIAANPRFELAGVLVYSPDKNGRDAGEICGIKKLGVTATTDRDAILDIQADCVVYNALGETKDPEQSLQEICRILESGKNVVSTAVSTHIYPSVLPPKVIERLQAACERGGVSFHSTGINPGFSFDVLPITFSAICQRIDCIKVTELVDMSGYTSASIVHDFIGMGVAENVEMPMDRRIDGRGTAFHASMQLLADALHINLDEVRVESEKVATEKAFDLTWGRVEVGTVAARLMRYLGIAQGHTRIIYEIIWRVSNHVAPDWPAGDARYEITIEGQPSLYGNFEIKSEEGRHISLVTAMHAVNAIPYVCESSVGVKTLLDLPLMGGGYFSHG